MQALFCSFVCMILAISCKDKEKKSHLPRTRHEFAVYAKKSHKCSESKFKTKQQSLKPFKLKFINFVDFF